MIEQKDIMIIIFGVIFLGGVFYLYRESQKRESMMRNRIPLYQVITEHGSNDDEDMSICTPINTVCTFQKQECEDLGYKWKYNLNNGILS